MAREEDKRRGQAQGQVERKEALSKARAEENEIVRRQQWSGSAIPVPQKTTLIPVPARKAAVESFTNEDEQRKKFLRDVEQATQTSGGQQQKSNIK